MTATERNPLGGQRSANQSFSNRRGFLKGSAALTVGFSALFGGLSLPETALADDANLNILGPRPGYSPQVGTFVSLLTWMREGNGVIRATKSLTTADLDYLIDPNANAVHHYGGGALAPSQLAQSNQKSASSAHGSMPQIAITMVRMLAQVCPGLKSARMVCCRGNWLR